MASTPGARTAAPSKTPAQPTWQRRFWTEVRGYAEALAIAFLVVTFVFNTVGVVGSSMRPNLDGGVGGSNLLRSLLTGDRVFIPKYETWLKRIGVTGPYRRGDIVVVRDPANSPTALETGSRPFFIKRVVAIPGDRLRIDAGQVIVNDMIVPTADPRLPFGGRGASGFGVTRGAEGLLEMTTVKAIVTRRGRWRPHFVDPTPEVADLVEDYLQAAHGRGWLGRIKACWRAARGLLRVARSQG